MYYRRELLHAATFQSQRLGIGNRIEAIARRCGIEPVRFHAVIGGRENFTDAEWARIESALKRNRSDLEKIYGPGPFGLEQTTLTRRIRA